MKAWVYQVSADEETIYIINTAKQLTEYNVTTGESRLLTSVRDLQNNSSARVDHDETPAILLNESLAFSKPIQALPGAFLLVIRLQVSNQCIAILILKKLPELVACELGSHDRHQRDAYQADQCKTQHQFDR